MTPNEIAEERYKVAHDVKRLRASIPSDDWLALYAVLNYIDLHHETLKNSLTSAKKSRVFMTSLLIRLLSDTQLRNEFIDSCGNMAIDIDSEGKVDAIRDKDGREYVYGVPPAQVTLVNDVI